jgi:hypothetical protein
MNGSNLHAVGSEHPQDAAAHYADVAALVAKAMPHLTPGAQQTMASAVFNRSHDTESATAALLVELTAERAAHPERFSRPAPAAKVVVVPVASAPAVKPTPAPAAPAAPAPAPQPSNGGLGHAEILQHAANQSKLLRRMPPDLRAHFINCTATIAF